MKAIQLTQGFFAAVDDDDEEKILRIGRWHTVKTRFQIYARHTTRQSKNLYMHRLIMDFPAKGLDVDHIDGDGLNNSKYNLRVVPHNKNVAHSVRQVAAVSGYRGVYPCSHGRKFFVRISVQGRVRRLGSFSSPIEAAQTYDAAALDAFGECAMLNFPEMRDAA